MQQLGKEKTIGKKSRASDLEDGKGRSVDLVKEETEGGVLIPFRDHRGSVVDAMKERIIRVRSRRGTARGRRDEGDVERETRSSVVIEALE